jgi:outer membrane protein assembly factor BamB
MVAALIDLGEDRTVQFGPRRRPLRRPVALPLALVLLATALLGGGAVARRGGLVEVVSVPAGQPTAVTLAGATMYVARDDPPSLTAYALPSGRLRWRTLVAAQMPQIQPVADAHTLLTNASGPDATRVVALDADTGAILWTRTGASIVDAPAGGRALLQWPTAGGAELAWVSVRTGSPQWTRSVPVLADVAVSHGPGRVLVTAADGAAQLLAEESGAVIVSGQVGSLVGDIVLTPGPAGGIPEPAGERVPVDLLGARFLVEHRRGASNGYLTGFDLNTFDRRWTLTGDLLGEPFACGQYLCLGSSQGLRAVDGDTGAVRWSSDRWQYAFPLASNLVLALSSGGMALLDADTGRQLALVGPQWTNVLLGDRVEVDGARPALISRPDGRHADRHWFSRVPQHGPPLGYLTGVDVPSCQLAADLLACQTSTGRLTVWRYR